MCGPSKRRTENWNLPGLYAPRTCAPAVQRPPPAHGPARDACNACKRMHRCGATIALALFLIVTPSCSASQSTKSSSGSGRNHAAPPKSPLSIAGAEIGRAPETFVKDFTRPISIPDEGIEAAVEVLRSGRLFRYSSESAEASQVALAEREFADFTRARYAVGVNSCSSAILLALLGAGVQTGDGVLTNAFTFTAVTSTVLRLKAEPILVECCDK